MDKNKRCQCCKIHKCKKVVIFDGGGFGWFGWAMVILALGASISWVIEVCKK